MCVCQKQRLKKSNGNPQNLKKGNVKETQKRIYVRVFIQIHGLNLIQILGDIDIDIL